MSVTTILFSPVTRLSGLLSVKLLVDDGAIVEANASGTLFRGFEYIMRDRHVTDAVYMTQRICGICSTVHGAVASYLLDSLYDNDISENAQYLRNVMLAADFLQNHIRHFYFFGLPDFVIMPDRPPFQEQNCTDCRLNDEDNRNMIRHHGEAVKVSQQCHQLLALFGGKAPHQHSFVHGGVAVAPTADKISQALSLIADIRAFVQCRLLADTEILAQAYDDYFHIGISPRRLLSFGLFPMGPKNDRPTWRGGVLTDLGIKQPNINFIEEDITRSWYHRTAWPEEIAPAPHKEDAYSWTKSVLYQGRHFEGGPLARMIMNGFYSGGTSAMDRIVARSLETSLLADLAEKWLRAIEPGEPPLQQKKDPVTDRVTAVTDAMRGPLLHSAQVKEEKIEQYNIITPTAWNFSPKDETGSRGPVEAALVGTAIPHPDLKYTIAGRIIRSFDPCISCATH